MEFTYPVHIHGPEPNEWVAEFPDFPEALTSGESPNDTLLNAIDCLEEAVAARIDDNEEIPEPSEIGPATFSVTLGGQMTLKASLYHAMREAGISKTDLARRLEVNEKEVRRMLDPHHGTKLPSLEQALEYLGKKIVLRVA